MTEPLEAPPADVPYRCARTSVDQRIADLLARMTLAEKVAQLGCVWSTALVAGERFSVRRAKEHLGQGIGQITRIGGSTGLRPAEIAAFMNRIQRFLVDETRLGIPAILHEEATGGLLARDADQLPHGIALASTWDPDLVREAADLIRRQMLAVGARLALAPVLDVARDPRWGRVEETYGEDPYLVARIGVAYVSGLQGSDLRHGVAATGKHFLGYAASEGGHNHKPAHIGQRELREVYARPFLCAIREARLAAVMNAYQDIDGLPCGGSAEILESLLRRELGFDGLVVADYFTTELLISAHRVAADKADAARIALEAGLDAELPMLDCYRELPNLVAEGRVSEASIDRSVWRVLGLKFALGLFEKPYADEAGSAAVMQTAESRRLARELARKSIVLLRNEGGLLPLDPELAHIAVVGPAADDPRLLEGDYHYPAHLEILYAPGGGQAASVLPRSEDLALAPGPYFPPMVTPLVGIRALVGAGARVDHAQGCAVEGGDERGIGEAVDLVRRADVAVVCLGGRSGLVPGCTSGEFRDAADLSLTGHQSRLVEAIVATGRPTVVVLLNGRVLALPWIAENVPAIVEAWLPGEEGGSAIAEILFGRANPSGRLPVSLPRSAGQLPVHYARKWDETTGGAPAEYIDLTASPLFPFGHGLSYARFEYSDLLVDAQRGDGPVRIELTLAHAGGPAGDEVVQLYLSDSVASVTRPVRQLVGFARVSMRPGERRRVSFALDSSQLAFYDQRMRFVVEPGDFRVFVGASSADVRLEGRFALTGAVRELDARRIVATTARIEPV